MQPRRLLHRSMALALAAVATFPACGSGSSPHATSGGGRTGILPTGAALPVGTAFPPGAPKCRFPPKLPSPSWYPSDLPLPRGSYHSQALGGSTGYHRSVFVVPGRLADLTRFVLTEWPKHGWILGRGDSESNEVEDTFEKPPAAGAFKAQGQSCEPGYSLMLVVYASDRSKIVFSSATPGTNPGSPIPPSRSG